IPIWSMTCCQFWEEPSFFRPATSCSLILIMRSIRPYHSERRSAVLRMVVAILAPFIDSTLFASSPSLHTIVKPPTRSPVNINTKTGHYPMFLAKDWDRTMLWPCSMK
uniref:Uncharacterized protein n=1 Tax=Echeneis naucrates TaxID=173247 RepID=A0A665T7X2_ECHNA